MTTSIANSFSGSLLEVLCDLELGINKSDVTDELLLDKITSTISARTTLSRMWRQNSRSSQTVIEERGWAECFTDQEDIKLKSKLLIGSIEPRALRKDVEAILASKDRSARKYERALIKIILNKALQHEREFHRRKQQRPGNREND
ncbi:hypothetical protein PHMEG_00036407 [Phytophthora megakarya]|uniref:Uncharacterized protein n=1 Tax=Phytophthora megakarya TaxID=4795 RepID=A0A225UN74_9STRA|nr:hypothetical protein PHMEG_00036407 [Phytophthora megakarya]